MAVLICYPGGEELDYLCNLCRILVSTHAASRDTDPRQM